MVVNEDKAELSQTSLCAMMQYVHGTGRASKGRHALTTQINWKQSVQLNAEINTFAAFNVSAFVSNYSLQCSAAELCGPRGDSVNYIAWHTNLWIFPALREPNNKHEQ